MHVIGTAGHVDHGKSTLVERLTGIDPDRFAEEKRRGLTIDLGFAWLTLPSGNEIGLIDVPGHERFIKNMLAGAGGISVCLFVVAANEGWMPQSAEHLAIVDLLGITSGVVAVTKIDSVDDETVDLAVAEVEEQIERSTLAGAAIVPCSAVTGAGIDDLVAAIDRAVAGAQPVADARRPRLWVDRVFTIAGAGTVVTGTLAGGSLAVGDEVEISPERRRARVRSLQSHKKELAEIGPGNRCALNLAGLERQGARRGDAIVKPHQWTPTQRIDVAVRVLPPALTGGQRHELTEKGAHLLFVGSAETAVKVKLLGRDAVGAGETGFAQLSLTDPLPLSRGDRFVLRDAGRILTFGGGVVLDPMPRPARRRDAARVDLLERLDRADAAGALRALVEAEGLIERNDALLRSAATDVPEDVAALADLLASPARVDELAATLSGALTDHHRRKPLERGMAREAARAATALPANAFDALVARANDIVEEGAFLRLASFHVEFAPDQERARAAVLAAIEAGGFTPPLAKELPGDASLLRALADAGDVIRIGDFYLTRSQAHRARALVRERIQRSGPVTVAELRDLLGTTRKYAVPLCEWLDQSGATRRQGDVRVLGPNS